MEHGVTIEDASNHARSLVAFEEMLEFLVIRLSQASDALALPGEEGELTSALRELSALMKGLAEDVAMESPAHRRALLRTSLPASLRAMLGQTYAGESEGVVASVQEALRSVARALAKVLPATDGIELEGACESLVLLLDRRQAFYRHTGVPGGAAVAGVEGADLMSVLSEEDWRRGVGFADWVDAVSSESTADVRRWRRAQIVEESSTGRLRLSFDGLSDYHDQWVGRDSPNIAPPGTRSGQEVERWRQALQRGSLVDALDPNNTWTNATVMDTRERMGAPVVVGVGPMGGDSADKGLDLLVSFRVYHPDGDKEEALLPETHEILAGETGQDPGNAAGTLDASPAARREEAEAMAAAAAPGGLGGDAAGGRVLAEPLGAEGGGVAEAVVDGVAAPAAGGWGLAGGRGGAGGSDNVGEGAEGGRRGRRYFGLVSRDEWISASSTRIEKLNSRAPWKNSWTEEAPVNDKEDPYLTEDGSRLVFAVPRAPVDGAPCLVANVNAFGQEGGFENLIVRLSPPALEEATLPAPLAEAPLPPAPPSSNTPPDDTENPTPPLPPRPPVAADEGSVVSSITAVTEGSGKKVRAAAAVPLEALRSALVAVASVRPLLARRVARAVLGRTATAVAAALKGASDSELRGLSRERLEGIVTGFREVLKRGHRSSEAYRRVEWLQLDLALKLYSCPFMERKLQGLKILADAVMAAETPISSSISQGSSPALTPQELVEWLDDNNFIKALFAGHTQLIRRSGDVVGFLCRERALTAGHVDIIWAAGGGGQDKDRRICVHEVLRPFLYQLDMVLLERLVDKLRVQPPDEVIEDTVTFIRETAEATQQGGAAPAIRLLDLLWAMADDRSPYRPRIKANAAESILPVAGLRGLRGHRAQTLQRCVKNVEDGRAVVTSLKVLEAVLQNYPKDATSYEVLSRRDVIHSLEAESGLTELLLRELESYVAGSRSPLAEDTRDGGLAGDHSNNPPSPVSVAPATTTAAGVVVVGLDRRGGSDKNDAHLAQVKARLHTLEHVFDNSRLVLSTEQIKRLWACLGPGPGPGLEGATPGEVSTLLSWFSKACEACEGEGGGGMFEPGVAAELFQELIVSDGEKRDFAATSASPEWFACFQTFFFKVNRQSGRMHVTTAPTITTITTTSPHADAASTGQTGGRGGGDDAEGMVAATGDGDVGRDTPPRDPDSPLDLVVIPSELSGMRALWNVALEAEDVTVVDQATRLLNRTHQELAPGLRDRVGEIREEYINTCMAYVKKGNDKTDLTDSDNDNDNDTLAATASPDTAIESAKASSSSLSPSSLSLSLSLSSSRRQRSVVRALHLLEEFVDETEMGGTVWIRGHGARVRGAKVVLNFENKVPEPNRMATSFKVEMHTNSQVWEVRRKVAHRGKMSVEDVELKLMSGETGNGSRNGGYAGGSERRSVEALDRSNSRRLGDLGLRKDDVWVVSRRTGPAVGRSPLLDASGRLIPKARAIFEQWFHKFENAHGVMDRVGAANFIDSCCHDQCKPTDERVNKFFRNYDKMGDGYMRLDDFLRLFRDSCKDLPHVVWSNLRAHHYRDDLTRSSVYDPATTNMDEGGEATPPPEGEDLNPFRRTASQSQGQDDLPLPLPRTIISRDPPSVKSLLGVLSLGGAAAAAAWRFLMRLPTNPEMLEGIRRLEGFRGGGGGEKWKVLLGPPGSHEMLYTLQIVDGVLDFLAGAGEVGDTPAGGNKEAFALDGPESLREWEGVNPEDWVVGFVRSGGFSQFCEAILTRGLFGDGLPEKMKMVDAQQACLALMLKVVRVVLLGVLSIPTAERQLDTPAATAPSAPIPLADSEATTAAGDAPEGGLVVAEASPSLPNPAGKTPPTGQDPPPLSSSQSAAGAVAGTAGSDDVPPSGGSEGDGQASPGAASSSSEGRATQYASADGSGVGVTSSSSSSSSSSCADAGSRERDDCGLWACLPRDVTAAVLGTMETPELQTRLMELAGVAADIADASSRAAGAAGGVRQQQTELPRPSESAPGNTAPLDLFGWVGEGAPADAMAQEALRLWVGVSRAPPRRRGRLPLPSGERRAEGEPGVPDDGRSSTAAAGPGAAIDGPILKAIFCASDAIRLQLAQSLLSVCGSSGSTGGPVVCSPVGGIGDEGVGTLAPGSSSPVDGAVPSDVDAASGNTEEETDDGVLVNLGEGSAAAGTGSLAPEAEKEEGAASAGIRTADCLREHVVRLLLANMPRAADGAGAGRRQRRPSGQRDCTQLFDVLCSLVEESMKGGVEHDRLGVDNLTADVVERLLAHPCTERRGAREVDQDTLLVGLLKLGVTIAEACPEAALRLGEGLVEALLDDFLFAPPTPASTASESLAPTRPKCKTVASRAMAYKLLAALCRPRFVSPPEGEGRSGGDGAEGSGGGALDVSHNLRLLLEKGLIPLRQLLSKPDVWGYSPSLGERSTVGRVGLRNLGNTCYVNSCLQQLFMMEPLRNGLLSLDEGDTEPGSLVGELQKLFGHLTISEKQAVDPLPFLRTVKDLDGNAIDVSVQQDAQGFLLDLFDKMEAGLKNTPQSSLMSTFEGRQITQLICPKPAAAAATAPAVPETTAAAATVPAAPPLEGEQKVEEGFDMRERGEAFMCVSLEVKNMVGVEDALEKFTEKEMIEGYAWDDERRDVSIYKRTVLGNLPPNVVLHLNRFKMNLDTFQTEKVNTRFDFPTRLDLEPFTKEGLAWRERVEAAGGRGPEDAKRLGLPGPYEVHPRSYYTYELRGVVVHTGTANQGHYFSYIRDPKQQQQQQQQQQQHASSCAEETVKGSSSSSSSSSGPSPASASQPPDADTSPSTASLSTDGIGVGGDEKEKVSCSKVSKDPATAGTTGEGTATALSQSEAGDAGEAGGGGADVDGKGGAPQWCEFNDTMVKEWAVAGRRAGSEAGEGGKEEGGGGGGRIGGLSTDCFGGQQTMQETDEYGWPRTLRKDNIQNAYLLFYERVDQSYGAGADTASPEEEGEGGFGERDPCNNGGMAAPAAKAEKTGVGGDSAAAAEAEAAAVPPAVFRQVWDDNNKFLLDRQLYHPDMSNFVLDVIKAVRQLASASPATTGDITKPYPGCLTDTPAGALEAKLPTGVPQLSEGEGEGGGVDLVEGFLEWGVRYLLDNLARALDNDAFAPLVEELQGLYDLRPEAAGALLDAETEGGMQGVREMLLLCPDRSVRVAMRGFYLHLLGILAEAEGDRYLDYDDPSPSQQQLDPSSLADQSITAGGGPGAASTIAGTPTATPTSSGTASALEEGTESALWPAAGEQVRLQEDMGEERGRSSTRLGRVVAGWVSLLPDAARSWGRFEQFLEVIEGISNMGDRERDLLLNRQMVCRLGSFFLQEKSPMYDPHKRLPRMGHKTAPPRFSPLVRCLRSLCAHSGETSRWQPTGSVQVQVESDTDTVSDSEGSRSDDSASSMRAVKSMPVGPVAAFPDTGTVAMNEEAGPLPLSLTESLSPIDREAAEATSGSPSSAAAAEEGGDDAGVGVGDGEVVGMAGVRGSRMTAKERSRSVALSPGCRRCLNCETLYDLAFEEHHAPEAAAELMCSWAADASKLLRPLSRLIVQGVDSTPFADVDSWLLALRAWLEVDDTLKVERYQLVLGTGKQEVEPKLLLLMMLQQEKYDKWLFRVLMVVSELLAENAGIGAHVSKLRSHEMLPWADWMTKHLIDTYGSARGGVGPLRVKEMDLIQIKENLSAYEKAYFGHTAEERLLDMTRRARIGPAEGEPGVTRVESSTSNGVQVEMLDAAETAMMMLGPAGGGHMTMAGGFPLKRFWRVTNHRMDSVTFTFKIEPTPSRLDTVYPSRRPNYHVPAGREVKLLLKPRETAGIMEVDKLDLTREFQPHPFSWIFEALPETPPTTEAAATAPPPAAVVAAEAAAAAAEAIPTPALPTALTASDLLEKQAQLEGDLGEAARVALKLEQEEAAEAHAAAIAAAKRAEEDELSQAVAATASSLPVIPYEVVSKVKADGTSSSEGKAGDVGDAGRRTGDEAEFWGVKAEAGGPRVEDEEHGETVLFSHEGSAPSSVDDGGDSTSAGETAAVLDADTADGHAEDNSRRVNV